VLFLVGCNFVCPYCHNPELAKGEAPSLIEANNILELLRARKEFLDGVVISGGEPTLQEDLILLCQKLKELDYPIKLDTKGSRPLVLKQLIEEGLVDYIAMDLKAHPFHYVPFVKTKLNPELIFASIRLIMESSVAYEFRTTCVKPIISPSEIKSIAKAIEGAKLYALQHFHDRRILNRAFFRGIDPSFTEAELFSLKELADTYVQRCIIR
jgi:pyruvate formate lyase activating enzyme